MLAHGSLVKRQSVLLHLTSHRKNSVKRLFFPHVARPFPPGHSSGLLGTPGPGSTSLSVLHGPVTPGAPSTAGPARSENPPPPARVSAGDEAHKELQPLEAVMAGDSRDRAGQCGMRGWRRRRRSCSLCPAPQLVRRLRQADLLLLPGRRPECAVKGRSGRTFETVDVGGVPSSSPPPLAPSFSPSSSVIRSSAKPGHRCI